MRPDVSILFPKLAPSLVTIVMTHDMIAENHIDVHEKKIKRLDVNDDVHQGVELNNTRLIFE